MLLYQIFLEMSCSRSSGASREHLSILFKFDKTCKKNQSLKLVKTCNKSILSKAGPCKETHRLAPQKWQYKSYLILCYFFTIFLQNSKDYYVWNLGRDFYLLDTCVFISTRLLPQKRQYISYRISVSSFQQIIERRPQLEDKIF